MLGVDRAGQVAVLASMAAPPAAVARVGDAGGRGLLELAWTAGADHSQSSSTEETPAHWSAPVRWSMHTVSQGVRGARLQIGSSRRSWRGTQLHYPAMLNADRNRTPGVEGDDARAVRTRGRGAACCQAASSRPHPSPQVRLMIRSSLRRTVVRKLGSTLETERPGCRREEGMAVAVPIG